MFASALAGALKVGAVLAVTAGLGGGVYVLVQADDAQDGSQGTTVRATATTDAPNDVLDNWPNLWQEYIEGEFEKNEAELLPTPFPGEVVLEGDPLPCYDSLEEQGEDLTDDGYLDPDCSEEELAQLEQMVEEGRFPASVFQALKSGDTRSECYDVILSPEQRATVEVGGLVSDEEATLVPCPTPTPEPEGSN
jgi:hypothetical protein